MSIRGSARFLLLFSRPRAKLGWGIGAAAMVLPLAGLAQSVTGFQLMERTGLDRVLHQRAWERALAGHSEQKPWPWEDPSLVANTKVPRLGMSAAVLETLSGLQQRSAVPPKLSQSRAEAPSSGKEFSTVAVGDRITVTGTDGSSRVYWVTGSRVVDPHLADSEPEGEEADATPVACSPLDAFVAGSLRVILQATDADPPPPEPAPSAEQKL